MSMQTKRTLLWAGGAVAAVLFVSLLIWGPWLLEDRHVRDPNLAPSAGIIVTGFRTMLVAVAAGAVAALGLYYTHRNHMLSQQQFTQSQQQYELSRRQFEHTQEQFMHTQTKDREQADIAREGQVTERYVEAIKLLGSNSTTERLGGIYSLDRIMRDSEKDRDTVISVLAAFVRQPPRPGESANSWNPREDVAAALDVLCRRPVPKASDRINLRGAHLRNANLREADLRGFNLAFTDLSYADLSHTNLKGANIFRAKLHSTNLREAELGGAILGGVQLEGTRMRFIRLDGRYASHACDHLVENLVDSLLRSDIRETTRLPPRLSEDARIRSKLSTCDNEGNSAPAGLHDEGD
ncbi:pentapeptide repeat-containing protein [Streptomyces rimosus]|uniref:pentapeptide repeat-containing protein n=1 Tax=Streptomyces rimosus TaxID=1927 RepID=UPI000AD30ECE|nr:pentapeptide repeat-containing protein [Streptomyces rimosus]